MATKPTSMASMVARQADATAKAAEKEDEKLSRKVTPAGKVWVRLIRPHYDAAGVYHQIGAALLDADAVPSSAKKLTKAEAVEEEAGDEADE